MKHFSQIQSYRALILLAALVMTCTCNGQPTQSTTPQPATPSGEELSWPRQFEDNGIKVSIFQPQIEKWEGSDFETRSAVAVTQGSNAPIYGVFWMKARPDVDKAARLVTLNDVVVTRPTLPSPTALQTPYPP